LSSARSVVQSEIRQLQAGRFCRFEIMEERRLLDADPIRVGVTYLEDDSGHDAGGDTFQVSFEGGAPGTELTHLLIDGDHYAPGLSYGDMIFDTVQGGLGADGAFPFKVLSSTGIGSVTAHVDDGSSQLRLDFTGFHAGEKLIFSIDVDEVQDFTPGTTDLTTINQGVDPIASGVEFQGSHLTADFKAPHYYDVSGTGEFRNFYDPLFAGSDLLLSQGNPDGLPDDNYQGQRDRSTGVMVTLQQTPLPIKIGGHVDLTDRNGDCMDDNPDAVTTPLANVKITLRDTNGNIVGTTLTDADGNYEFENLLPGNYTLTEETPPGLIDADSNVGTINNIHVGDNPDANTITHIVMNGGDTGINYDFCESQPASVSGYVYHDANNDGVRQASETPIPGTTVILQDANGTQVATTTTDSNGFYKFAGLSAGTYQIHEVQPSPWMDGKDAAGTILGQVVGAAHNPGDQISGVTLLWGDNGIEYDFGELLPGSISGHVHNDPDGDCSDGNEDGETPIAGVTMQLLDSTGKVIDTTQTDANGFYQFLNLAPGTYAVREIQPAGYLEGDQHAGSGGGDDTSKLDELKSIPIHSGDTLVDYDFCETLPVSIAGIVWLDTTRNCEIDEDEARLGGVTIQLFDAQNHLVATTQTATDGTYKFTGLHAGTYHVHEVQPAGYFEGCTHAGSLGGDDSVQDDITNVVTVGGDNGINYNFSEVPAAEISGYVFRDGAPIVTSDGQVPANLYSIRDGQLTPDDQRIGGVHLELRYTLTGEAVRGEDLLPGMYPPGPVTTVTDANGFYHFGGLPQGNYTVLESQPGGYDDSKDTPGTTTGLAVNIGTFVSTLTVQTFAAEGVSFHNDAILQIPLAYGQHSQLNNFSEVQVVTNIIPPPPPENPPPPPELPPMLLRIIPPPTPPEVIIPPAAPTIVTGGGGEYTWHLSVIDAGHPRVARRSTRASGGLAFRSALWIERTEWQPDRLRDGVWIVHNASDAAPHAIFGISDAIPVTGDFNGDGRDEIAMFHKGEWFLDLNGNGQWDAEDLWAKLGDEQDRPVTGDWDGDGKDDIGIFGPKWPGDPVHIENDPGLPDQDNLHLVKPRAKNVPPNPEQATDGERLLRLTSQGKERADLIDHVFEFGGPRDIPIAGDWNGDGIRSIGVFRDGKWHFDLDGDGRWSDGDKTATFGEKGDLPVVGDFNGDGIEEIAIFRNGTWIIDSNGNRELDPSDQVIKFGQAGDKPIAGDFDGDGVDEPAVYRPNSH
jgi:protocatechuate 3,4-dioxygenase beta subunit